MSVNLLDQHAARQPGALRSPVFTPLLSRPGQCTPLRRSRPTYYFTGGDGNDTAARLFNRWSDGSVCSGEPVRVAQWLCSVPPWAGLGTLRSAIALSHSDVVASAERAVAPGVVGTSCLKCWQCGQGPPHLLHPTWLSSFCLRCRRLRGLLLLLLCVCNQRGDTVTPYILTVIGYI